jgi:hypothetical protein
MTYEFFTTRHLKIGQLAPPDMRDGWDLVGIAVETVATSIFGEPNERIVAAWRREASR